MKPELEEKLKSWISVDKIFLDGTIYRVVMRVPVFKNWDHIVLNLYNTQQEAEDAAIEYRKTLVGYFDENLK